MQYNAIWTVEICQLADNGVNKLIYVHRRYMLAVFGFIAPGLYLYQHLSGNRKEKIYEEIQEGFLMKKSFFKNKIYCSHCGSEVDGEDQYCPACGKICEVNGWKECGTERCGKCYEMLHETDKYCRICGTKVGEGSFDLFKDQIQMIYGPPPVERFHRCNRCGYSWDNCVMIDEDRYCPECGGKDLTISEKRP